MLIVAPFQKEVLEAVNKYQENADYPYTCQCGARLVFFRDGSICQQGHKARNSFAVPDDKVVRNIW